MHFVVNLLIILCSCIFISSQVNDSGNFVLFESSVAYLEVCTCLVCLPTVETGRINRFLICISY